MIEIKQSSAIKVPVRIVDTSGTPVTGLVAANVSVTILKSDGTVQEYSPSGKWTEPAGAALTGSGMYLLTLDATTTSTVGPIQVAVKDNSGNYFIGSFLVVAYIASDIQKIQTGRWKIHVTGADANRLVLYDTDGTTVLMKFDLKDAAGASTFINPFERVPA